MCDIIRWSCQRVNKISFQFFTSYSLETHFRLLSDFNLSYVSSLRPTPAEDLNRG